MAPEEQRREVAVDLQRSIEAHGQRKQEVVQGSTTLPRDVFDACDPLVERALAEAAMKVFRRHMMGDEHVMPEVLPAGEMREEKIPVEEIRATVAELCALPTVEPPDLQANLLPERMWILLDMSKNSAGLARQRATAELREFMASPEFATVVGPTVLATLVELLDAARTAPGAPLVLQALHLSAEKALRASAEVAK